METAYEVIGVIMIAGVAVAMWIGVLYLAAVLLDRWLDD